MIQTSLKYFLTCNNCLDALRDNNGHVIYFSHSGQITASALERGWNIDRSLCDKCGNYANGAVRVNLKIGFLVIPVCKSHINEIDPEVCQAPFHVKASLDKINPK